MTSRFGTLKRLVAVLIALAIVVAAGTVVGQAPELFGADVAEEPEASIGVSDQTGNGSNVTVDNVTLSEGGFVVVADADGRILGVSDYLESGSHENVTVEARGEDAEMEGRITATVHRDTDDDQAFTYEESDGEEDQPFVEDGYPVSDAATVTTPEDEDESGTNGSFRVESVDAPGQATVNGTLNVTAEIHNPNEFETRQHVEFRLDGMVHERRVLSLGPDESTEIEFQIDLAGVDAGTYTYGIYTTDDGSLGELVVADAPDASVTVVDADDERVVVDATLPEGGFLALENASAAENGTDDRENDSGGLENESETLGDGTDAIIATSDDLEPGDHENVTLELDAAVDATETLAVVAYEGETDAFENATAYTVDGERVAATVEFGAEADDSAANDSSDDGLE